MYFTAESAFQLILPSFSATVEFCITFSLFHFPYLLHYGKKVRFDGVNQLAFRLASILAGAEYVLPCCNRFALAIFAYELSKLDFIIAFGYTSSV